MAMTHEELISMMAKAIPVMPDELASKHFDMYPTWESVVGKEITQDMIDRGFDRYQYNGILYKVLQAVFLDKDFLEMLLHNAIPFLHNQSSKH